MNDVLYQIIHNYRCQNEQERKDQALMLKMIQSFPDVVTRNNELLHFTASSWIINAEYTKVLMVYHHIYDSWSWCGGHLDGSSDPLAIALQEGKEETGLKELTLIVDEPIAIDILPVHGHYKHNEYVSSHLHLNVTYLCKADDNELLRIKADENSGVAWFSPNEIRDVVTEKEMLPVYDKLIETTSAILKL